MKNGYTRQAFGKGKQLKHKKIKTDNRAVILDLHNIVSFCCYTSILQKTRINCWLKDFWFDILFVHNIITNTPINTFFLKWVKKHENLKFYNADLWTSL